MGVTFSTFLLSFCFLGDFPSWLKQLFLRGLSVGACVSACVRVCVCKTLVEKTAVVVLGC